MAKDITLVASSKQDFFNFCAAPHGDSTKNITLVFFDAKPYGYNLMTSNPVELRQFLTDAHARGIKVEFLSGDKSWATPQERGLGEALIDEVTAFNTAGAANQRFDGIHYDVEPYLLRAKEDSDALDWEYDKAVVWNEYLALLTNCQAKVNTYNTAYDPDIRFGVAIPYWYGGNSVATPQEIIDRVDYVAVMAYKDTGSNIVNAAQDEVTYANGVGKKVYVAVEASQPVDTSDFPPSTTFYEEGNSAMETALSQVDASFSGYSSYSGVAIHYYENLAGSKGYEASYRKLWDASNPYLGYTPVVYVGSPSRSTEIFSGTVYIQWDASDLDGDSISINIQYSANGGTSWTNVPIHDADGNPRSTNDGKYAWNTSVLTPGSNYLVKVTGTDNSVNNLTGYDVSNGAFTISGSTTTVDITDLHTWVESSSSLRLKWTPPNCTPRAYRIYRSVNGGAFSEIAQSPVVTIRRYIDTGLSSSNKYKYQIKAIYGNGTEGNISNTSNTLIPDSSFLIDYFEGPEGLTYYGPYGTGLAYGFNTDAANLKEGTRALRLNYTYAGGWGAIVIPTFQNLNTPPRVDISPYNAVTFWAKGTAGGTHTIRFQLRENGGYLGDESWQSPALSIGADWAEYNINFSDFTRESVLSGSGDSRLNTHTIGSYAFALYSGDGSPYTYYIDEIKLVKAAASISVSPDTCNFGTLIVGPGDHRFRAGPIAVSYAGYSAPWTIRIWTNNGTGADKAGLKGTDQVTYIPLKVWCANYGPTASVPDEEDDAYWVSNETGWFRVPEDDEMVSTNRYTWRRLAWSPGAELSNPFDIYLAIDINGKPAQDYQTTTLTIEYLSE